jgi:hypothetical protein
MWIGSQSKEPLVASQCVRGCDQWDFTEGGLLTSTY